MLILGREKNKKNKNKKKRKVKRYTTELTKKAINHWIHQR